MGKYGEFTYILCRICGAYRFGRGGSPGEGEIFGPEILEKRIHLSCFWRQKFRSAEENVENLHEKTLDGRQKKGFPREKGRKLTETFPKRRRRAFFYLHSIYGPLIAEKG